MPSLGKSDQLRKGSKKKVDEVKDTKEFIWVTSSGKEITGPYPRLQKFKKYINTDTSKDDISWANGTGKNPNEETLRAGKSYENILHNFATYNTLFTLSGLSEEELENQTYFSNAPHEIIARSGGIGKPNVDHDAYKAEVEGQLRVRNKASHLTGETRADGTDYDASKFFLDTGYDIFFENVNILSTTGPNTERGLANFTKMEFELHEPFGISLVEKIRSATFINGYLDYQDAPLLLTIEWKGWDEHGKEVKSSTLIRKIPIRIVKVEFDVDASGAKYTCVAVAADDFAHDDRFKFPRRTIKINRSTWPEWQTELKKQLNEQMENEKTEGLRELNDEYNFLLSEEVRQDCKDWGHGGTLMHSTEPGQLPRGANMSATIAAVSTEIDSYTSLVKLFEDAIRNGLGYSSVVNEFWYKFAKKLMNDNSITTKNNTSMEKVTDYLTSTKFEEDMKKEENQYINWFIIKPKFEVLGTNKKGNKKWDSIRKMHPKKITFVAVRQKIHVLKFIKPGVSLGNINWSTYVRKKYNYIYTGENIDIQNLKINYKSAYYMRNLRPFVADPNEKGKFKEFRDKFEDKLNKIFGAEDNPEDPPLRQEPSVQRGKSTVVVDDPRMVENQQFYDYLTNPQADMMKVELTILGDPAYVCQDQFTNITGTTPTFVNQGSWNGAYGSFNAESYQPLILLNYRLPEDYDDKTGVWFEKAGRTMFFSGVYQVVKIESSMSGGEFTQVLHCVRMNNQKGTGAKIKFGNAITTHYKKLDAAEAKKAKALKRKRNNYGLHTTFGLGEYD